jgi:hypothetical protein
MSKWRKIKLVVGGLFGLSLVAMARAAMTANTDKGIRSDGTKAPRAESQDAVQGDPKGGAPPYHEESATPDAEGGRSSDPENRTTEPAAEAAKDAATDSSDEAKATD